MKNMKAFDVETESSNRSRYNGNNELFTFYTPCQYLQLIYWSFAFCSFCKVFYACIGPTTQQTIWWVQTDMGGWRVLHWIFCIWVVVYCVNSSCVVCKHWFPHSFYLECSSLGLVFLVTGFFGQYNLGSIQSISIALVYS